MFQLDLNLLSPETKSQIILAIVQETYNRGSRSRAINHIQELLRNEGGTVTIYAGDESNGGISVWEKVSATAETTHGEWLQISVKVDEWQKKYSCFAVIEN